MNLTRQRVITYLIGIAAVSAGGLVKSYAQTTGATWQVQKYDVNVTLPQDEKVRSITAKAIITAKNVSGSPAGTLTLRLSPSAEVTAAKVNDVSNDLSKSEEKLTSATSLQRVALRFPSVAPGGSVTAAIDYKLNIKDNSGVAVLSPAGSQFLPLSFWYPTPNSWFFTKGADMAPVRITVTAPAGQTVVSSGAEITGAFDQRLNGQPFFVTGSWDRTEQNGVAVYMPKGATSEGQKRAAELAAFAAGARDFITGIAGKAPDVPLRIVSSRRGAGFASGGTIVVDEGVFRRAKVDSLTFMNITEAVAKLWFGGSIAVNGDGYGVISEGLSRYLATQYIENKLGKDVADVERLRQRTSYAAVSKRDVPMSTVSPVDDFYFPEVANKGAMVWRILARRVGATKFADTLTRNAQDGSLTLAELRMAFSEQKPLLDYLLDQLTDMDLQAGIPRQEGGEWKVALRNTGATDVTVDIAVTTSSGERLTAPATIRAKDYGEIGFKSPASLVRAEIDAEKLYPQIDYSNDASPHDTDESDPLLAAKRLFDKQDFTKAETTARTLLSATPRFDDLRIILARALLAQGKTAEAQREFQAVLDDKAPTARSIAWANEGLAEIAGAARQTDAATRYIDATIAADADYGASLAARNLRTKLALTTSIDPAVRTFFSDFDKAAAAKRKADIESMMIAGEATRFASGIAGSAEQWTTQVTAVDRLDPNTLLVEASMNIKRLNSEPESGLAVYRLIKVGNGWRLAGVDMFEVR